MPLQSRYSQSPCGGSAATQRRSGMSKRIVFMGAGAVGGYVGGHFARIGEDVTSEAARVDELVVCEQRVGTNQNVTNRAVFAAQTRLAIATGGKRGGGLIAQ